MQGEQYVFTTHFSCRLLNITLIQLLSVLSTIPLCVVVGYIAIIQGCTGEHGLSHCYESETCIVLNGIKTDH